MFLRNVIMNSYQWRKWFLFLIFSMYRRLDTVDGLKCYCNSDRCPNLTCETDGFCYASTSIEHGVKKETFQCWDQENIFPPGDQPIWCRDTELPDNITCCATDYCNRELFTGIISVCWVSGAGVGLLPLFGWHNGSPSTPGCYFVDVMDYNYLLFLYFATIVTPSVLLAAFYAHIYRVVLKQLSEVMTVDGSRGRISGGGTMLRVLGAAQKREVKATQNLAIIVFFFIVCWIPLYTVNAVKAFKPELDIPNPLTYFCVIFSHLNSAINPFLYAYHLKDFRAALKGLICSVFGRGTTMQAALRPPMPVRRPALERCNALRERPKIYINSPVWLRQREAEMSSIEENRAVVAVTPVVPDVEPFLNKVADGSSGCHTPEGRDSEAGPYLIETNDERCQSPYRRVEDLIRRVRSGDHS